MIFLQKLRTPYILEWVSSNFLDCPKISVETLGSLFEIAKNPKFYGTKKVVQSESPIDKRQRISHTARNEAQAALFEYLYCTRNLQFMDAEHMSKNSPHFLQNLLAKVDIEGDVQWSITRFLRYHPINEFEPFFESLGLKHYEYIPLLPNDLMFLSDDELLLENYHVLCNYGVARNKIGKIYKEATQIFQYDNGVLKLKLQAYQELGLSQSFMVKVVVCSPNLLIGGVNADFIKVLERLRKAGLEMSWIEEHLSEKSSYNWNHLLVLLNVFSKTGYIEEQLVRLISQHPGILFEDSGDQTLSLIGFLLKFGYTMNRICSMFQQFPQMQVGKFFSNMRHCFLFLNEIEMEAYEIGKIVRAHPLLLGSYTLKKSSSMMHDLNVGKKRLCQFIQWNPQEMRKWVMRSKVGPLPGEKLQSKLLKTQFLVDLGFVENSNALQKVLKVFPGRGMELKERFDCIMDAGVDGKDVCKMVETCPNILGQSKDVIEMKIDVLVNYLGYPISTLVTFPLYLAFRMERVKLRSKMYNWLKEQGTVNRMLCLSTIVPLPENIFISRYVNQHPRGPEVWQNLKKTIYSEP